MDSWHFGHFFGGLVLPKWLYISENSRSLKVRRNNQSVMLNRQTVDLGLIKLATHTLSWSPNKNNVPVNVPEINLSDKERQVLDFIIKKNNITAKEIAEKIGVSDKTVKRAISTLKTNGLIVRIGGEKKGFWSVKENLKERWGVASSHLPLKFVYSFQ